MRSQRDGAHARNERLEDQLATVRTDSEQQARQHATERGGLLAQQQLQESMAAQSRVQQHEIADLQQARQLAEQVAAAAQRELSIQVALVNTYTTTRSSEGRAGDGPQARGPRTGKQGRAHTPGSK